MADPPAGPGMSSLPSRWPLNPIPSVRPWPTGSASTAPLAPELVWQV